MRISAADLSTVETLVEQLAHPDDGRVLYAIDLLETLEKRHLVTPLLLSHESAPVRERALRVIAVQAPEWGGRWQEKIARLMGDEDELVRVAAMHALAHVSGQFASDLVRPHLDDPNPRVAATAAAALAQAEAEPDRALAETTLARLVEDTSDAGTEGRRTAAAALARLDDARFHRLLMPLLGDADPLVIEEALRSARQLPGARTLLVFCQNAPSLVVDQDPLAGDFGHGLCQALQPMPLGFHLRQPGVDAHPALHQGGALVDQDGEHLALNFAQVARGGWDGCHRRMARAGILGQRYLASQDDAGHRSPPRLA